MEQQEKRWLAREVAELVQHLSDRDARRLRKALALSDGGKQLLDLLAAFYRLPVEQRVGVIGRLEQMIRFRLDHK